MSASHLATLVISERLYDRHLRWPAFLPSVLTATATNLRLASGQLEGYIHGALAALVWLAEREEARQAAVRG